MGFGKSATGPHAWVGLALIAALACSCSDTARLPTEDPPNDSTPGGGNPPPPPPPGSSGITVNPAVRLQTMVGWEATAEAGHIECPAVAYNLYKNPVYDRAINELGINRVRLQIGSGVENPRDFFAEYRAGKIAVTDWRQNSYTIVNDNADPNAINPAGFHFTELDYTIDQIVLPLKQRLEARGERLYINLNYVDFGNTSFEHKNAPAEYGEFMLAVFQHLQSKYGWVPDAIEVVLEPDNQGAWTAAQIGQAIMAAGARLKAAGYRPDFIAPSNKSMLAARQFFDQIIGVAGIREYVKELAYHRYGGVSDSTLQSIGARAVQYGVRTSMLEHIGSGYEDLHKDLKLGRNSAWAQYTLAFCGTGTDRGGTYYPVNTSNVNAPVVITGSRTKFLRQYFYYVRANAVRIDATSTQSNFDPLAFTNANGKTVVVVKTNAGGSASIHGLPAGRYGRSYTTGTEYMVDQPDVTISAGEALTAGIPARGVLTVYAR